MSAKKLSKNLKVCGTCALWSGDRNLEFGGYSKFQDNVKAKCVGGVYNKIDMLGMSSCAKWELWPHMR